MLIKNTLAALPGRDRFAQVDIKVKDGKIVEIGPDLDADARILDVEGLWVLPGGIDPHVHFDDPGYTDREDFFAGTSAAASGGVTTVIDMPCTSVPPVTNVENLRRKLALIEKKAVVDFGLYGGVCAQSFAGNFRLDMRELAEFVLGFKTYFVSGMDTFGRLNHYQFQQVLAAARELGVPVLLHAEDYDYVTAATQAAMQAGTTPRQYYESRPEIAEILAVGSAVALADSVDGDLHIVHVGTARAGALLRGSRTTAETTPQYLEFDEADFERIQGPLKVTPPVKGPGNKDGLWALLGDGTIDFVASDHAPSPEKEKYTGSVWTDYGGLPGVGTLLPYVVSEGFIEKRLPLSRLVEVTSAAAAKRYGLAGKGAIEVGCDADLVVIDPAAEWVIEGRRFLSKGKITPFEGMRLKGQVVKTLVRGQVVYDRAAGIQVQPGYGRWIPETARQLKGSGVLGQASVVDPLPLVIGNGVVTDGSRFLVEEGAVRITGNRIERVGPLAEMSLSGVSFVDVGGRIIVPGLLNAHHHLYSSLATGLAPLAPTPDFVSILDNLWWSLDLALDEESIYYSALFGVIESVKHGVTTIFDHHASMGCARGSLALVARAFREVGAKGLLCLETSDRMGPDAVSDQIAENLAGQSDDAIRYAFGLHANFTLSNATLERVAAAKPKDAPIHIHCGEDRADLEYCLENGFRGPVDRLNRFGLLGPNALLAHAIHLTDADYQLIQEVRPIVVSNPESNANNRVGTMDRGRIGAYVLGTDGMSPDMVETLRSHYLLNAVPFSELKSVFFDGRYAVQQRFFPDTGSLVPGSRADLAVLDYAPSTPIDLDNLVGHLVFGARGGKAYMTVADGKVLYRDGEIMSVDEPEVRRAVAAVARNLHKRYYDGRPFSQR